MTKNRVEGPSFAGETLLPILQYAGAFTTGISIVRTLQPPKSNFCRTLTQTCWSIFERPHSYSKVSKPKQRHPYWNFGLFRDDSVGPVIRHGNRFDIDIVRGRGSMHLRSRRIEGKQQLCRSTGGFPYRTDVQYQECEIHMPCLCPRHGQ